MKEFIKNWFWSVNSDFFFLGLSLGITIFSPHVWLLGLIGIFVFYYLIYKYYTEEKK